MTSPVLEILLLFKIGQISLSDHGLQSMVNIGGTRVLVELELYSSIVQDLVQRV